MSCRTFYATKLKDVNDVTSVRESYVKRLRDNYLMILRTLMHDLIVSIDTQGNFVFVNDAAVDFWGEPKEKLLGSHFSKYIHPDDISKTISVLQELIIKSNQVMGFITAGKHTSKNSKIINAELLMCCHFCFEFVFC